MRNKNGTIGLLLAALLTLGVSEESAAGVVSPGSVSSTTTLNFGNSGLLAPFDDSYLFTIVTGKTFDFSSFISTGFVTLYIIGDFEGTLFGASGIVANGISSA